MNWKVNNEASVDGTGFHGFTVDISKEEGTKLFGEPEDPSGDGKVAFGWIFENEQGTTVSLYEWKGSGPLHIGGKGPEVCSEFASWLVETFPELSEKVSKES